MSEVRVKRIKFIGGNDDRPVLGASLFSEPYANVFLLAKKKSGKTFVVNTILRECTDRKTKLVFIVSTIHKDPAYESMLAYFRKRGNPIEIHTALIEDKTSVLTTYLAGLNPTAYDDGSADVSARYESARDDIKQVIAPIQPDWFKVVTAQPRVDEAGDEPQDKPAERVDKRSKYLTQEVVFILDDLGTTMRHSSVYNLLNKNRHYKSKVIISSQHLHDLLPNSIGQLDYLLIFKGQPVEKLVKAHELTNLSTEYNMFYKYYNIATADKYSFLNIDITDDLFRTRFAEKPLNA